MTYRAELITPEEERALLDEIHALPLREAQYRQYTTARWGWQHSIPPTKELRHSVTFRTARSGTDRHGRR